MDVPAAVATHRWDELEERVQRIAREVAAVHAAEVDRDARFPHESLAALKEAKLLGAFVPLELGGLGCSLADLAAMCTALGRACSATGMVMAMHQIQVVCLVRHGLESPGVRRALEACARDQRLIASVTSEMGVGGDMRSSVCAVEVVGDRFTLRKDATTISYGAHADDYLATARRDESAPASDQVLVFVRKEDATLEKKGNWDTLGMRGTCSPPFLLQGTGPADQVLAVPFARIASESMVPVSHILWAHMWLGIASDAVQRARTFVREQARRTPGVVPPTATRAAELHAELQVMRAGAHDALVHYQELLGAPASEERTSTMAFALRMNNLKLAASQQVVALVHRALLLVGIAAYKNDSKFSLGRHLRDSHSAALMVGNDRILAANAALLLVTKDD